MTPKEFRLKSGATILDNIRQFGATEKAIFGVLVIVAAITAFIMAGQANAIFMTPVPGHGGELREGVVGLPRTINPVLAVTDVDRDLSSLIYSGLMRYENGRLSPDLAKSYSVSKDGLVYTFDLRPDLKFHDGLPLGAEDVVFTIQKIQDPALKSPRRADWANVTVKAVDSDTVEFDLKQPYSLFLSNATVGIIPRHIWKDVSNEQFIFSQYNIEPVGSGPYKPGSISRDSGGIPTVFRLSAWRDYGGKEPHVAVISFNFFADEEKALDALGNNSIDSLASIPSAAAKKLASNSGETYTIISAPLPRTFAVFFNQNQSAVLSDKNVRKALDMSVNRGKIVVDALDGYGQAIFGPLPPEWDPVSKGDQHGDVAAAQALLEKNGWKKNSETGIYEFSKKGSKSVQVLAFDIYTADTPDLKAAAELVRNDWTALGASVNIKIFEPSDLYQNVIRTRKYDALLFGQFIGKDRDLYAFWHSSQRNSPGLNIAMYVSSKADKLLEEIRTTDSEVERAGKYEEFSNLIRSDVPAVFLYVPDFTYAIPKALKEVSLGDISVPSDRWNSVSDWYINTEWVWKFFASKDGAASTTVSTK